MQLNQTANARLAGALYLTLAISGMLSILYIPGQLIDWSDPAATVSNILENQGLFQLGIILGWVCYLSYLLVALALYRLYKDLHPAAATIMVIFVAVSVPISYLGLVAKMDILAIVDSTGIMAGMSSELIQAQTMLKLQTHHNAIIAAQIFWGLWLFPLGLLALRSDFTPNLIGYMLIVGCFYYLVESVTQFTYPAFQGTIPHIIFGICAMIGEFGLCLWLLIMADKKKFA